MKRLLYIAIAIIVILGIQNDLTGSTLSAQLPTNDEASTKSGQEDPPPLPYQEVIIESGQTVLSIVEHLHDGQVNHSIEDILADFSSLNDGTNPNAIQIGKTYRFPLYQNP
ncbi:MULTISPECIES: hypothetical protein [Shouchella]|uniref:LysM domain-containing protein n=2 Tax=Shouchella TaxID=2893057 RepID=A0ABY7W2G9_9BACI|nr:MULTISPECIES: hypothetical protein [Shouchella]MED4127916.1 hypothetical protein [Shouchella miscanthi]WDF03064.1 hypothetical protein PQ477_16400 [Shouchella hunanensis]